MEVISAAETLGSCNAFDSNFLHVPPLTHPVLVSLVHTMTVQLLTLSKNTPFLSFGSSSLGGSDAVLFYLHFLFTFLCPYLFMSLECPLTHS